MKKIYFSIFIFVLSNSIWSQETAVIPNDTKEEVVPIAVIEEIPIFPGCEDVERKERMNCFQLKLSEHIQKNLKYPKEAEKKGIVGRVTIMFVINKEGEIENIVSRGPANGKILEDEARRIVSLLPKMTPGFQRGKPVKVRYALPFNFNLK